MSLAIRPFALEHAQAAAAIHAEGQPGTFLTGLGPAFLGALYTQMATSERCFGYVAVDGKDVVGIVTGTTNARAVFKELVLRRGHTLILPVAGALLHHPDLVPKVLQTFLYPSQIRSVPGEAELFFIGTRAARRGEGIGRALFEALAGEARRRGMKTLGLTVDEANRVARTFYERRGMRLEFKFTLYGRGMYWLALDLAEQDESDDRAVAN